MYCSYKCIHQNNALCCIIGLRLREKLKNIVIYSNTVILFAMIYHDNKFQYRPALMPSFLKLVLFGKLVRVFVCVSTHEVITNQWYDMHLITSFSVILVKSPQHRGFYNNQLILQCIHTIIIIIYISLFVYVASWPLLSHK